jgi:hypothetical protein
LNFLGRGPLGGVDERKALDLTLKAVDVLNPETQKQELSLANNHLSAFYLCAQDPTVRKYVKGMTASDVRELATPTARRILSRACFCGGMLAMA